MVLHANTGLIHSFFLSSTARYVDFSGEAGSACALLEEYSNLVVLQTVSKSFGMAGIRLGMAFASKEVSVIETFPQCNRTFRPWYPPGHGLRVEGGQCNRNFPPV